MDIKKLTDNFLLVAGSIFAIILVGLAMYSLFGGFHPQSYRLPAIELTGKLGDGVTLKSVDVVYSNSSGDDSCTKYSFARGIRVATTKLSKYRPNVIDSKYRVMVPLSWRGGNSCGWRPVRVMINVTATYNPGLHKSLKLAMENERGILEYTLPETAQYDCWSGLQKNKFECKLTEIYGTSRRKELGFGATPRIVNISYSYQNESKN